MNDRIEVGEYVRTKKGLIAKVCAYEELRIYTTEKDGASFYSYDTDKGSIADVDIKNHSELLIDLIEVGDFVNGYPVLEIHEEKYYVVADNRKYGEHCIYDGEIKTILTHEQYNANCFRVEG